MPRGRYWLFGILAIFAVVVSSARAVEPDAPEHIISDGEAKIIELRIKLAGLKRPRLVEAAYEIDGLSTFYGQHKDGLIWFSGNALSAQARQVVVALQDAAAWGLDPTHFELPAAFGDGTFIATNMDEKIDAELRIGLAVLRYGRHARGGQVDPVRLSLDFNHKPQLADPQHLLNGVRTAKNVGAYFEKLHPQHPQFQRLRKAYLNVLYGRGANETATAQRRDTRGRKLSRREQRLLEKLRVNMQMWRWIPRELGGRYVWANIPEYQIRVVDGGRTIYRERIVVGKTTHKTPVFSDEMETVVFQPYWYVPNSIKVKELLPRLLEGQSLRDLKIAKKVGGEEIDPYAVDWYSEDIRKFVVYQPPNERNALGRVKFLFPNEHAVYFHDTPEKELFERRQRAFSHGCMRVRNPLEFARVLLHKEQGWEQAQISWLANSGPENNVVRLKRKLPVHVTYFTAWVDDDGRLETFKDVYRHEHSIAKALAGRIDEIAQPKEEDLSKARSQVLAVREEVGHSRQRRNLNYRPYAPYAHYSVGRMSPHARQRFNWR